MREWSLGPGDPLCLTLAADSRFGNIDYVNDHIWEVELGTGEPPTLSLYTTYGLRARSMRIFPRFSEENKTISNPAEFSSPPTVRQVLPNYLVLDFSPYESLAVNYELRIPQSHAVAGRLSVTNHSTASRHIRLEMCGALVPLEGHALTHTQMQMVNVLVGQTGNLVPLLFLTGGPQPGPGPHPSLMVDLDLGPGASRQLTWSQAAMDTHQNSFDLARIVAAQPWEAERARIELINSSQTLEIHTGDTDWDAALALSQKAAFGLFLPGNEHFPQPTFVQTRGPDYGFSRKGDGSDYPASWSGQSPLDTYYLASLLPVETSPARGALQNFLSVQNQDGEIDGRPGLGQQRGRYQAMPVLASLAWKLYRSSGDEAFLEEAFPKLLSFFWAWFSPANDRDRDGIPEWSHPLQTGYEDNPLFDTWSPWSQGADITCVRSPALLAFLYREAQSLIQVAEWFDRQDEVALVRKQAETLKNALQESWNARAASYTYRDRETGQSTSGKILGRSNGSGPVKLKQEFDPPVRLLIEVQTKSPAAVRPQAVISEFVTKGENERILGGQFRWRSGGTVATSQQVHAKVGKVHVRGVDKNDRVIVRSVDYSGRDHTLLTPLWAGVPDLQQAQTLVGRAVLDAGRFDHPFGIPACPYVPDPQADPVCLSVHMPWNQLIGEGMLAYGFRSETARLVAHLMNGVIQNLKQKRAFYQNYHAETGKGIGERNALNGLAPVGLFLQVLGVQIVSASEVHLEGKNPYPWPVTLKYKGLKIERGLERTKITFPNGKNINVDDPAPCVVSL